VIALHQYLRRTNNEPVTKSSFFRESFDSAEASLRLIQCAADTALAISRQIRFLKLLFNLRASATKPNRLAAKFGQRHLQADLVTDLADRHGTRSFVGWRSCEAAGKRRSSD